MVRSEADLDDRAGGVCPGGEAVYTRAQIGCPELALWNDLE